MPTSAERLVTPSARPLKRRRKRRYGVTFVRDLPPMSLTMAMPLQRLAVMNKTPSKRLCDTGTTYPGLIRLLLRQPDQVVEARFVPPAKMFIRFADGLGGTWSFHKLLLDMTSMEPSTIRVAALGTSVTVKSKWNDTVELDASALRAAIDPDYASEQKRAFLATIGPLESLPSIPQR